MALMVKGASLRGIFVGSAAMARELNAFVDLHGVKPVIDGSSISTMPRRPMRISPRPTCSARW